MLKYYLPMSGDAWGFLDPRDVDLVLLHTFRGISSPESIHLRVTCQWLESGEGVKHTLRFYKLVCSDIDESPRVPYRMGLLRLAGVEEFWTRGVLKERRNVFALWRDINLKTYVGGKITLAPVPFDLNGYAVLPYQGEILRAFLVVVGVVLRLSGTISESELAKRMGLGEHHRFQEYHISWFLDKMDTLGITRVNELQRHEILMSQEEFKEIFGVELPEFVANKMAAIDD